MPKSTPEDRMADKLAGRTGPPGHNHWARTGPVCDLGQPEPQAGGFVPTGRAEAQPEQARPEGYGYGMPPSRTEHTTVTVGAQETRHTFTTSPSRLPRPSGTEQLEKLLAVVGAALARPTSCNADLAERLTRGFAEHLEANLEDVPSWAEQHKTTTPEHEPVSTSKNAMEQLEDLLGDRAVYADKGLRWSEPYATTQGELLTEAETRRLTSLFLLLALEMMTEPHQHDWHPAVGPEGPSGELCTECGAVRA